MNTPKLRLIVICMLLLLLSSSLYASDFRLWDPKDGLPIRQGYHIGYFKSMNTDTNGNICVVWSDCRQGDGDIYAQLITSDGEYLWGDNGKLIVSEYSRQEFPHVLPDGNGNWIITWIDFRNDILYYDHGDLYMQKVDSNGDPMWSPATGVKICDATNGRLWQQSFTDGNGGAVVIWIDNRENDSDIYAQHVDQNGTILWEENGKIIAGGPSEQGSINDASYSACADNDGGIIFSWIDDLDPTNRNIYANRISIDGELVWADSSGLPICMADREQNQMQICPDGNGGAFFVWRDGRNFRVTESDIYGQHIDSDGTISWDENGVPICNLDAHQSQPRIVNTGTNEAVVIWEDKRVDLETEDIYSQKISDNNGSIQFHWGTAGQELSGNLVCDVAEGQMKACLASDLNGGVYISWVDERYNKEPNSELFGQHLDSEGNRDWSDPNGIIICDQQLSQNGIIIHSFNNSSAGFVWADYRNGSPALYFQIFNINGNAQLEEDGEEIIYGIDESIRSINVIPSNGGNNFITWEDYRYGYFGNGPFMQRINNSTGEILGEINGFSLIPGFNNDTNDTTSIWIDELTSISDNNGGAISAWVDNRFNEDPHIFVQKVDESGNILWGDRGKAIAYTESDIYEQDNPHLVPTDDGGVIVIYNQLDDEYFLNLWAQRLNSNGEGQWSGEAGSGFRINAEQEDDYIRAVECFQDGSILVVYRVEYPFNVGLSAQRILLSGEKAWENPVEISTGESFPKNAKMLKIGNDILVVWEDQRRGHPIHDIYGQIISADGSVSLAENGLILVEQDNQQVKMNVALVGDYFWMVWQDSRDGLNDDIYVQKFDFSGIPQLTPSSGILVGLDSKWQYNPSILPDGDDGIYIAWEESGERRLKDIRYTHLKSDGTPASTDYLQEGLPLSVAIHEQMKPVLIPDGENGFVSVWEDCRSTGIESFSNIYMQRVNDWIVSVNGTPDIQPEGWALENAYPNPFNPSTKIAFNVGITSNVKLTVYDILGREVVKLVDSRQEAGNHIVNWNGKNATGQMVSSGTYFYRLEADDVMITRKMVLIK